jgi:hypothetical protein
MAADGSVPSERHKAEDRSTRKTDFWGVVSGIQIPRTSANDSTWIGSDEDSCQRFRVKKGVAVCFAHRREGPGLQKTQERACHPTIHRRVPPTREAGAGGRRRRNIPTFQTGKVCMAATRLNKVLKGPEHPAKKSHRCFQARWGGPGVAGTTTPMADPCLHNLNTFIDRPLIGDRL